MFKNKKGSKPKKQMGGKNGEKPPHEKLGLKPEIGKYLGLEP